MTALRVTESDELKRWVALAAEQAREKRSLVVPDTATASRVLPHLRTSLGNNAICVFVPKEPDQLERVLLDTAAQSEDGPTQQTVDAALHEGADLASALDALMRTIGKRPVVLYGRRLGAIAEEELTNALSPRVSIVRDWLNRLPTVVEVRVKPGASFVHEPPLVLSNGGPLDTNAAWEQCGHRLGAFELALAQRALLGKDAEEVAEDPGEESSIRRRIIDVLPREWGEANALLGLHGRPLDTTTISQLVSTESLDGLMQLGLCQKTGDTWRVDEGWVSYWASRPLSTTKKTIQRLAGVLAERVRPSEPEAWRQGLTILEAARQLVASGEWRRAGEYARYGVSALVDFARSQSIAGEYALAAEVYESALALLEKHVSSSRMRGYVQHYLHFNRARAELESLSATVEGYRRAVGDWPENALFWSRLARAELYREHRAEGLQALEVANTKVPSHPDKDLILVARTARGLLAHNRIEDAVVVWKDYTPDTPLAIDVESKLDRATSQGWTTERLLDAEGVVTLCRPMRVQIERLSRGFRASLPDIDVAGPVVHTRVEALERLVASIRKDVRNLLAAYTHRLSPEQQSRKHRLLKAVDIVASGLVEGRETAWVFGNLVEDGEGVWLKTGGNTERVFEVPSPLVPRPLGVSTRLWFAEVKCDPPGIPKGPVLRLEEASSREGVWDAWAQRMRDVGS